MPLSIRAIPLMVGAAIVLALLALLTARLLSPPARSVELGEPGDAYLVTNFYQPEHAGEVSFRWSGSGSTLVLPAHVAERSSVRLRLHAAEGEQWLRLATLVSGLIEFQPGEDWRIYKVLLAAPQAPHTLTGAGFWGYLRKRVRHTLSNEG